MPSNLTKSLLAEAKGAIQGLVTAEAVLLRDRDLLLDSAWMLGSVLVELKAQVGRGHWYLWLDGHLPELGSTQRMRQANAARCIRFFRDNPHHRKSCDAYAVESIRRLMWGYIPAKERPQLKGNERIMPLPHYLTFVNNFWKWDRQVRLGRVQMPPVEQIRRELGPVIRRQIEICGRLWLDDLLKES